MGDISLSEQWYVLRISYSRELKLKEILDVRGIENFVPMRYVQVVKDGQRKRVRVPAVHNLVFVHATYGRICSLREEPGMRLSFHFFHDRTTRKPLVIPDSQMRNFLLVAGAEEESLLYLSPEEVPFERGRQVRVLGGPFAGAVGTMVRLRKDRRVVVQVQGVMAVATTFIHPSLLQPCPDHLPESEHHP